MALESLISKAPFLDQVTVVGISYRTADLGVRSAVSFTDARLTKLRQALLNQGADSVLILSTCNRTELYVTGLGHGAAITILAAESGLTVASLESHLYVKSGADAAMHLFRVASGLDSAALGETEILAQVKAAWRKAIEAKAMSGALDILCRRAISVSKRVRTETELCRNVTSVASMAVRQASTASGGLSGKRLLLVGAGAIAERLAKEISLLGDCHCMVINRTSSRAEALAGRYGFEVAPFGELAKSIRESDVLFAAVSGEKPLIDADLVGDTNITVVDLGVPAAVASLPSSARVVDMELLLAACEANASIRAGAVSEAEAILQEELSDFLGECGEREVAPAIAELVQLGEKVRRENLNWALANLDGLSESQQKVVEDLALRIMRGVLQGPISALKSRSLAPGACD